jgi:hypothetical protein
MQVRMDRENFPKELLCLLVLAPFVLHHREVDLGRVELVVDLDGGQVMSDGIFLPA